jgi:histidyl-tRNA synthetase
MQQLTLNYDRSEFEGFESLREFMQTRVVQICIERKKLHKMVAADMDMAPSCLTRKLAGAETDKRRLTVDDLELYVETQQDTKPVLYLVDKYLTHGSDSEIAELERLLAAAKKKVRK